MLRVFILLTVSALVAGAGTLDRIAHVESGRSDAAVGDNGRARGAWQMHQAAWEDVSARRAAAGLPTWPFSAAHRASVSRLYAADHLAWLQSQFTRLNGRKPTQPESYALWNLGLDGFAKRKWDLRKTPQTTRRAIAKL